MAFTGNDDVANAVCPGMKIGNRLRRADLILRNQQELAVKSESSVAPFLAAPLIDAFALRSHAAPRQRVSTQPMSSSSTKGLVI